MAWRYCKCGNGLDKPTSAEDLRDGQSCPHCSTINGQWQSIEDWVIEIDERLRAIEQK